MGDQHYEPADQERTSPDEEINTGGGAAVDGNVQTEGGDFIGRDKFNVSGNVIVLSDLSPESLEQLGILAVAATPQWQGAMVRYFSQPAACHGLAEFVGLRYRAAAVVDVLATLSYYPSGLVGVDYYLYPERGPLELCLGIVSEREYLLYEILYLCFLDSLLDSFDSDASEEFGDRKRKIWVVY